MEDNTKNRRGPKTEKREALTAFIRESILKGVWKTGEQLPTRAYFQERFGSLNLVQGAFRELVQEEFLTVSGTRREGTRVNPRPPFLHRYAVLLEGRDETDMNWHGRAVFEAVRILRKRGLDIEVHFDLDREFDDPEHLALNRRIMRHAFAGVYRDRYPQKAQRRYICRQDEIPIAGQTDIEESRPNLAPVDAVPEVESALWAHLQKRGIRSAALLRCADGYREEDENRCRRDAARFGVELPRKWFLSFGADYSHALPNLRAALDPSLIELPQSLVVPNDNCLPYVAQALDELDGDPRVANLEIVAIGNYPYLPEFRHPVKYFAYDHLKLLEDAIAFFDAFRRGEHPDNHLHCRFFEWKDGTPSLIRIQNPLERS